MKSNMTWTVDPDGRFFCAVMARTVPDREETAMAIETIGDYQLHLVAYELPSGSWDPFVTVLKFDDATQDFICVAEKLHGSTAPLPTHDQAIDAARRTGTALIEANKP